MDSGVKVLVGPQRRASAPWAVFGAQVLWLKWVGPSVTGVIAAAGAAIVATGWRRHLRSRELWLTDEEVVIANSAETHVVPKAGAAATLVDEEI